MGTLTKRILSMVLALCLCFALLPTAAMTVEAATPDYTVSAAYKASSYYSALCNVTLTGNQRTDIVNVALSQVGYREGSYSGDYGGADDGSYNNYTEYNYWYHNYVSSGMPVGGDSAPWCATFVSWCAEQANIPTSILKRSTAAGHGASYFNVNFYSGSSTLASSDDNDSYFMGYNYTPQVGDLFFTRIWSHVGLVVGVSGNYVITVEGNTNNNGSSQGNGVYKLTWRKITDLYFGVPNYTGGTSHTCNKGTYVYYEAVHPHYKCYECSICGNVWRNTEEPTIIDSCSDCVQPKTIDDRYSSFFPIASYPLSTGHINVYDVAGNQLDNRYIDGATDICIIWEVYTDGWCKVRYPSSAEASGYFDAYVPFSTFTESTYPSWWTTPMDYTTYKRSDLSTTMHSVSSGEDCMLLITSGSVKQIIHPVEGQSYSMMGWISDGKQIHVSESSLELMLGGTESQVINAWSTGSYDGNTSLYFSKSNSNISCSWGDWTDGKAPLIITANSMGSTTLTIGVKDSDSGTVLDSTTVTVTITAKTYTISYNANGGSGAPGSQTKYHNTTLALSSTKPTRSGYTFLGWSTSSSATSATYQPGGSFTSNSNTTLYAVWEKGCESNSHSYASSWSKGEDGHWHECSACGDKTDFAAHDYGDGDKCVICEYERAHIHRLTLVSAVDATCTADGNVAYYTCSGCENWFEDASGSVVISDKTSVVIVALGHDMTEATCTEVSHCKREGCEYTEGSALGHSFTNYVSNNDATCTGDGTKTAKCDRCDVTDTITDAGSAKGHDYADATCTAPKTCKVCGITEGNPLGHSFTNYVSNNDATCTGDGTKTAKCDRCDVTDTITDAGSAKGHDYAEATCTDPKTCKVCGATDGEARGHSYATTWSKGEDGHWHECSACGDKTDFAAHDYSDGDKCVICEYERAHIHRLTLVPAVDATCTTDGNVAYYTCSGCENWFEDASGSVMIADKTSVVIEALGHDLADATCTEAAKCQREGCGHVEGEALGHSFTNYVSNNNATCTEDGTKTAKCDRCDVTDTITDVGSAKGHNYADATCTAPKTCKVCGATDGEALGHSYATTWSKGEDGHWHECSACGDKTDFAAHDYGDGDKCVICEYERAHIHRLTLVPAVDATCTTDGNVAYYTCSGCENWFEDAAGSIVIPDKTSVVVAALGHDMSEATCTEAAYCQREGCDYTEGAALGHVDENADNKCDNCGVSMGGEQPTTPDKPTDDVPQTGDISKSMMWTVVLMLSIVGTIICVLFSKKKNMS